MFVKGLSRGFGVLLVWVGIASGQTLPTSARIESVPLELTMPERYQVAEFLEPIRRVTLIAPADGFVRSIEFRLGAAVRELQEIAQLDRNEASARLKMALAEVKEKQAQLKAQHARRSRGHAGRSSMPPRRGSSWPSSRSIAARCARRSPGESWRCRCVPGSMSFKGTTIAELADVTALKTLCPSIAAASRPARP